MSIESYGYRVTTYSDFMAGDIDMPPATLQGLRARAIHHRGSHVVYDPSASEGGWLLVGPEALIRSETQDMIDDGADGE